MNSSTVPETMRRSSRVPLSLPLHITSLEPGVPFSEDCETLVVNAHGCAVRTSAKLAVGVPVHFLNREGRQATAYVVDCRPLGIDQKSWLVGARLDEPNNYWGVQPCPSDWTPKPAPTNGAAHSTELRTRKPHADPGLRVVTPKAPEPLSEERVRTMLGEILQPLHQEVIALREKVSQAPAKRSSFEVSLTQIPPELEEKLWLRLREELGELVVNQATQQTERVLETAKSTIGQNISSAKHEFRQHLTEELQLVQVRAQRLSDEIDDGVRQQLETGLASFRQEAIEVGTRVEERGDEFIRSMQQRLSDENDRRLQEVQQVRAAIDAEAQQMQTLVSELGNRIEALNESARHLESGMDEHLSQVASDIVSSARSQLESHVDSILTDMQTRAAKELSNQLDVACGRLKLIQKGIETSVSELLNAQATRTMQSFEHSLDEQAGQTVVRWRASLARDLTRVAKVLGSDMQLEAEEENNR